MTHDRFYWLALPEDGAKAGQEIVVSREGQTILIEQATDCPELIVRLNDAMLDLDQPVRIVASDKVIFEGKVERRMGVLVKTLVERGDPRSLFSAEITLELPPGASH